MVTELSDYTALPAPIPRLRRVLPRERGSDCLSGAAASRAEALDLASFRRRHVVRSATHLAHEPLLLHLAAEVPESLLELGGILYDDTHNSARIAGTR
jgi:hypothetical protein